MSIQLGRSDCGREISEKQSLWGIEISPHGQFKYQAALKIKKKDVDLKYTSVLKCKIEFQELLETKLANCSLLHA